MPTPTTPEGHPFHSADWHKLKGTSENWEDGATGERISKRQWQNLRREEGSLGPVQRTGEKKEYKRLLGEYQEKHGIESRRKARSVAEFKQARRDLSTIAKRRREHKKVDDSANGRWAHALVVIGRRDPNETARVGHTPPKKAR
jgi:hypothetical protein